MCIGNSTKVQDPVKKLLHDNKCTTVQRNKKYKQKNEKKKKKALSMEALIVKQ